MNQRDRFYCGVTCFLLVGLLAGCQRPPPAETSSDQGSVTFATALQQAKGIQKELAKRRQRAKTTALGQLLQDLEPTIGRMLDRLTTLQERYQRLQEVRQQFDREALQRQEAELWEKANNEPDLQRQKQYERHLARIEAELTHIVQLEDRLDAYTEERDAIVTALRNLSAQLALLEAKPEGEGRLFAEVNRIFERLSLEEKARSEVDAESPSIERFSDPAGDEKNVFVGGGSSPGRKIRLVVIDYSSQKEPSSSASSVVDGLRRTAWVSSPSSPFPQYLVLGTADGQLANIAAVQLCSAAPGPQAPMAIRNVTLFGSQEVEPSRTVFPLGTHELPKGRPCHRLTFPERSLRVLVIQINRTAGDASALVTEVTAYGREHSKDNVLR